VILKITDKLLRLKFSKREKMEITRTKLLIQEYDEVILPASKQIANSRASWRMTRETNKDWGMVDPEIYDSCDVGEPDKKITKRGYESWQGTSLIFLDTTDEALRSSSEAGSVAVRNTILDSGTYKFKPAFENLEITKFIKSLPVTDFIGIRCVSLTQGTFAGIHRDGNNFANKKESTITGNPLWKLGYVSLTINISNGEVPLLYSVDGTKQNLRSADDLVYLFNDFYLHGVPLTKSRRRQIRVTGRPTAGFEDLIDRNSAYSFAG
jgi:hypothetical protein